MSHSSFHSYIVIVYLTGPSAGLRLTSAVFVIRLWTKRTAKHVRSHKMGVCVAAEPATVGDCRPKQPGSVSPPMTRQRITSTEIGMAC